MDPEDRRLSAAEQEADEFLHRLGGSTPHDSTIICTESIVEASSDGDEAITDRKSLRPSSHADLQGGMLVANPMQRQASTAQYPPFGDGKPYPPHLPDSEQFVVEFAGPSDPLHPKNWPTRKKLVTSAFLAYVALASSFGSSVFSAAVTVVAEEFNTSTEVTTLGISLYVLGYATGPIMWAPMSELYGRKPPLLLSSFIFVIFNIALGAAKDLQTVLICRFFAGFMGACPLTVVAALYSDIYDNRYRGVAVTVFSMAVFCGPLLSPFIGGFIVLSSLGWRWTAYITAIMGFLGLFFELWLLEETYPPVVLAQKASSLRRLTGNWGIHARQEKVELDLKALVEKNLSRPLRMLFTEPILLALSIYMAFIYGLLYLFLEFFPIVFQEIYGMNKGVGGLPYFGMIVGEGLACIAIILDQPSYNRKLISNNNISVPEWRLPITIAGGFAFAGGLFWFGWTGYTGNIHWIVPTIAGVLIGFGLLSIFQQCLNYVIDAYLSFAASAVAANTFLRSAFAAAFPLFAKQLITSLGVQWAGTLLGCIASMLIPIPILLYYKGPVVRKRSRFGIQTVSDSKEV